MTEFDGPAGLELDGLDSMFVVGIAGGEGGDIVVIFEGERKHVGGEHDIDAFFDLASIRESPQPAPLEGEVGDETEGVEEPLLFTAALILGVVLRIVAARYSKYV